MAGMGKKGGTHLSGTACLTEAFLYHQDDGSVENAQLEGGCLLKVPIWLFCPSVLACCLRQGNTPVSHVKNVKLFRKRKEWSNRK